jgi:hypothetical protein
VATQSDLLFRFSRLIAETDLPPEVYDGSTRLQYLNHAYAIAQQRIEEVAPEEFTWSATANIVLGLQRYSRPMRENVRRYEILCGTGTTAVYREIPLITPEQAVLRVDDPWTGMDGLQRWSVAYSIDGPELVLWPVPTLAITAGMQCVFHDVQVLTAPTDIPQMPVVLHPILAYGAAIQALEETKDAAEEIVDRYRARWASIFGPWDASTDESRAALKKHFRVAQSRPVNGQNLGVRRCI